MVRNKNQKLEVTHQPLSVTTQAIKWCFTLLYFREYILHSYDLQIGILPFFGMCAPERKWSLSLRCNADSSLEYLLTFLMHTVYDLHIFSIAAFRN